ncbi:MAG TPA: lysylphosphatidylglycerol synthase transmembrane domain-containing protein [Anaerolineales bacterium]|nr:lysylphosphatidylglycerol synthase transmembrane domain-containing protein [Anaerolineales bacterium]
MTDWLSDNRRFLLRFAGTLLAIGLIVLLLRGQGWDEITKAFKQLSFSQILLAFLLILLSRFCVVVRWYILLRSGSVKITFSDALALTFTGLFSNNFLPTTIGGDVVRLAGAMQMGYDRAVSLASLVADRLIGVLAMVFTLPFGVIPAWHIFVPASAASALAVPPVFQRMWDFVKRTLQTFSTWFKNPLALLAALACTWGHVICTCVALDILISGLGGQMSFGLVVGLWSIAYFVTLVPISINGYGVQELSLTFLFSRVGNLSAAVGLTLAVLIRVMYMAASVPGAAYLPTIMAAMEPDEKTGLRD